MRWSTEHSSDQWLSYCYGIVCPFVQRTFAAEFLNLFSRFSATDNSTLIPDHEAGLHISKLPVNSVRLSSLDRFVFFVAHSEINQTATRSVHPRSTWSSGVFRRSEKTSVGLSSRIADGCETSRPFSIVEHLEQILVEWSANSGRWRFFSCVRFSNR